MLLAGAHDPVARTQGLNRAEDQRDHMVNVRVGILDDTVLHPAHHPGGQPLPLRAARHLTHAAGREAWAQQRVFRLRHGPL